MAWYNPWSKSGEGSGSEARSSTSKSTPASPPPPPPTTRTPTAGSSKTGPAASPPHTHPHNAIDLSPELFQKPPPAEASPQTLISCLSPTIPLTAFGVGLASGIFTNASKASLVFLAENAHRKPTTMQGWYFYNKTKNYRVLWAAAKGGMKGGLHLGAWSSLFALIEGGSLYARTMGLGDLKPTTSPSDGPPPEYSAIHRLGHWTDGMLAGQGVGLLAAVVYRTQPVRFFALGTVAGTLTGLLQDIRDELVWRQERKEAGEEKKEVSWRIEPVPASETQSDK